jgi:hypothetical protein
LGATLNTLTATNTAFLMVDMLLCDSYAFRIVAPPARKGTSFEKHGGANARSIVNRKFFDVKDDAAGHCELTKSKDFLI